ncbi:MAG: CHASE2 domain-containing protein [Cyanobacteria bacterium J06639_14]
MEQRIIVNLGQGSWQQGFPTIVVQLWEAGRSAPIQLIGRLPAAPELATLYTRWQSFYRAINSNLGLRQFALDTAEIEIEIEEEDVTHVSEIEFETIGRTLKHQFNEWLSSSSFINAERRLRTHLNPSSYIELILEADDPAVRRFPWHLWHLLEDYPHAEVAIGALEYRTAPNRVRQPHSQVRVLSVLGDSTGIQVARDRDVLNRLAEVEAVILDERPRTELTHQLWDSAGWDILFFAGHSFTQSGDTVGRIKINESESLSISQLKFSLKKAIKQGLQLAIFNSCDGMGIAWELSELNIPYLIVMREPVPDQVAQTFLMDFLSAFASGTPFSLAVREAREKLEGLEGIFPGASWLPVICQNPTAQPLTWQILKAESEQNHRSFSERITATQPRQLEKKSQHRLSLGKIFIITVLTTLAVMGIRSLGVFEPLELSAYDHLLKLRPAESQDERILIVEATPNDFNEYGGYPLKDQTLTELIDKLEEYKPSVIGLDMHRAQARGSAEDRLQFINQFKTNSNLFTVCHYGTSLNDFGPPQELIELNLSKHLGFSNLEPDKSIDGVVRRQALAFDPNRAVPTNKCSFFSFGVLLADRYLTQHEFSGITFPREGLDLGKTKIQRLFNNSMGYQKLGDQYQILIDYRSSKNNEQPFKKVSIYQILSGNVNSSNVKDKVILIGTNSENHGDFHETPYGSMPGVEIHAHLVSQLLDGGMDGKQAIWGLPQWHFIQWGDGLWVLGWSALSGLLIWRMGLSIRAILMVISIVFTLYLSYLLIFFFSGGWMPLWPSIIGIVVLVLTLVFPWMQIRQVFSKH